MRKTHLSKYVLCAVVMTSLTATKVFAQSSRRTVGNSIAGDAPEPRPSIASRLDAPRAYSGMPPIDDTPGQIRPTQLKPEFKESIGRVVTSLNSVLERTKNATRQELISFLYADGDRRLDWDKINKMSKEGLSELIERRINNQMTHLRTLASGQMNIPWAQQDQKTTAQLINESGVQGNFVAKAAAYFKEGKAPSAFMLDQKTIRLFNTVYDLGKDSAARIAKSPLTPKTAGLGFAGAAMSLLASSAMAKGENERQAATASERPRISTDVLIKRSLSESSAAQ